MRMSQNWFMCMLALSVAALLSNCSNSSDTSDASQEVERVYSYDEEGPLKGMRLQVRPGSYLGTGEISMRSAESLLDELRKEEDFDSEEAIEIVASLGPAAEFGPSGALFEPPATLYLPFSSKAFDLAAQQSISHLVVMAVNDDYVGMEVGPVGIIGMEVGPVGKTVTGAQLAGGVFGDIAVEENPGNVENDLLAVIKVSHFTTFEVLVQNVEPTKACVPNCTSKGCGDDGCGTSCGECAEGMFCDSGQQCSPQGDLPCDENGDGLEFLESQEFPFVVNTNVKEVHVPSEGTESLSICPVGDSDWFSLKLTNPKVITVKMNTEYPDLMGWNLIKANSQGGGEPKFTNATTEKSVSFTTETLDPGDYIVEIKARPNAFSKTVPAYSLVFSTNVPCVPQCSGKICGPDGCEGQCGVCTGGKFCKGGQCFVCGSDSDCDDGKECTKNVCISSGCIATITPNGQMCSEGVCSNGDCVANANCDPVGVAIHCDSTLNKATYDAPVNEAGEVLIGLDPKTDENGTFTIKFKLSGESLEKNVPYVIQTLLNGTECGPQVQDVAFAVDVTTQHITAKFPYEADKQYGLFVAGDYPPNSTLKVLLDEVQCN